MLCICRPLQLHASYSGQRGRVQAPSQSVQSGTKKFKFKELTKEQFDTLILLSVLKSPADGPLHARILQKLKQDGDQVRFNDIITDCVDFLTTKADCRVFANENVRLNAVQKPPQKCQ